jgi:hypothetical protein
MVQTRYTVRSSPKVTDGHIYGDYPTNGLLLTTMKDENGTEYAAVTSTHNYKWPTTALMAIVDGDYDLWHKVQPLTVATSAGVH